MGLFGEGTEDFDGVEFNSVEGVGAEDADAAVDVGVEFDGLGDAEVYHAAV